MTQEEKAKAYDEALENAKEHINSKGIGDTVDLCKHLFPQLRESEKPLTPFQQCLNLILRKVYFASISNTEDINKFILDIVKNHTGELVELAKKHEYTDYQLCESEDERIRKGLIEALKVSKTVGELKFIFPESTREECIAYLEKQGEQKVSVDDFKAKDWYVSKVDGKIHNIYYSVDKVKPKFKVGDKIIEKDFDECGRGTIIDIKDGKYIFDDGGFICIEEQGLWKLVEQKPAEWSEEDEEMLEYVIGDVNDAKELFATKEAIDLCDKEIAWLKSLRGRPMISDNWKPVSDCHDLEEEVKRYLCEECSGDDEPTVSEIARHFTEWQKAKMMEEAVEEIGENHHHKGGQQWILNLIILIGIISF